MRRNTLQQALVLDAVTELHCHASADQVYDLLAQKYPNISRATVYRNLNKLSESKKIIKIEIPNSADRFDHQCFDHYHIICTKCKKVFDVDMSYLKDLETNIKNKNGFTFLGHNIVFNGICPNCTE